MKLMLGRKNFVMSTEKDTCQVTFVPDGKVAGLCRAVSVEFDMDGNQKRQPRKIQGKRICIAYDWSDDVADNRNPDKMNPYILVEEQGSIKVDIFNINLHPCASLYSYSPYYSQLMKVLDQSEGATTVRVKETIVATDSEEIKEMLESAADFTPE